METLEAGGWEIVTRGWPDFVAVRGNVVRFIEVKPAGRSQLRPMQQRMIAIFKLLGIPVEVIWVDAKGATRKRDLEVKEP